MRCYRCERRQFGRRQTRIHGWVYVRGREPMPCVIENISVGGALISLATPKHLTSRFRLVATGAGIDTQCEVRHHGEEGVGVSFLAPVETAGDIAKKGRTPAAPGSAPSFAREKAVSRR